jgi:ABC-type transport system involved in cytochrome c biogenesis permease subunit
MIRRVAIPLLSMLLTTPAASATETLWNADTRAFLAEVDTEALAKLPLHYRGRPAILDTLARHHLRRAFGRATVDGVPPAPAMIELYVNTGAYLTRPVLRIREARMREVLADRLPPVLAETLRRTGRIPPACLLDDDALARLLMRNRASVEDIRAAGELPDLAAVLQSLAARPGFRVPIDRLRARLHAWLASDAFRLAPGADNTWPPVSADHGGLDPNVTAAWSTLAAAWHLRDAGRVNRTLSKLTARIERAAGRGVASPAARSLELWYNRLDRTTFTWIGFAVAAVLLLVALSGLPPRGVWRIAGLGLAFFSTAVLGAGFLVRWMLSGGAWYLPPIMNQFEAVTAACLAGAAGGLVVEGFSRRGIWPLAGSAVAAAGMLCGALFPVGMNAAPSAAVGILSSPIMAAHVGIIILGHALAGMTAVTAVLYLAIAAVTGTDARSSAPAALHLPAPSTTLAGLDRFHALAVPLTVWTLGAGIALGAVWADFAWNRWWGWDRKETWALLTWAVFVVAWHVRPRVSRRRRGMVTAWLCLLGAAAMLFNWIVVNYLFTGLHSYA